MICDAAIPGNVILCSAASAATVSGTPPLAKRIPVSLLVLKVPICSTGLAPFNQPLIYQKPGGLLALARRCPSLERRRQCPCVTDCDRAAILQTRRLRC